MALNSRSGIGSQVGIGTEVTYGTRVAPTTFVGYESETFTLDKNFINYQPLRADSAFQQEDLHIGTTRGVSGELSGVAATYKDLGKFLNLLHGNTVTPVQQAATTAYLQTHNIGNTLPHGKSATIQGVRHDTTGTARPFDFVGCVVTGWSLTLDTSGIGMFSFTFDGRDEDTAQSVAVAAYSAGSRPFTFRDSVLKIGGAAIANARSVTLSGSIPKNTDRHYLGSSGLKAEPIVNAIPDLTAAVQLDFASMTDHDRFKNETVASFALEFTGPIIASTYNYSLKLTFNAAKQTSWSGGVSGPDIISTDANFEAQSPTAGGIPVVVEYMSTATTI